MRLDLSGCGTALLTPFKNSKVDYDTFASLVDRQVDSGIDVLVPLGTTGETPCLEDEERIRLLQIAKEHSKGRPVIVGGGTNSLRHTIRSMQMLQPYGPDAFLIFLIQIPKTLLGRIQFRLFIRDQHIIRCNLLIQIVDLGIQETNLLIEQVLLLHDFLDFRDVQHFSEFFLGVFGSLMLTICLVI